MGKEDRVVAAAKAVTPPWEAEVTPGNEGMTMLMLTRGDESLSINWDEKGLVHPLIYSLSGIREVKLRNVSAAIKDYIQKQPNYSKPTSTRRVGAPAEKAEAEPIKASLPFDIVEATDAEIIKACRGRKLVWLNEMMGEYEMATVPDRKLVEVKDPDNPGKTKQVWRTNRNIRMTTSSAGRRILTFPAVGAQYRSVGLDRLVQVR